MCFIEFNHNEFPSWRQHRSCRGFTLTELLVTITIIIVLASVAFVVLGKVRQSAMNSKCVANLRQLALAGQAYVADKGSYPGNGKQPGGGNTSWVNEMKTYLGFEEKLTRAVVERDERFPSCEAALKAAQRGEPPHIRTYSMNSGLIKTTSDGAGGWAFPGLRTSLVRDMSRTAFFSDGEIIGGTRSWQFLIRPAGWLVPQNFVHMGKVNVVFLDGHVQSLAIGQVSKDADDPFWNPTATEKK